MQNTFSKEHSVRRIQCKAHLAENGPQGILDTKHI